MTHSQSLRVYQGAVVCADTTLTGSITVGPRTLIHPKVTIVADGGPIIIGESNIFEEQCVVTHRIDKLLETPNTLMIGSNNVFEVGCTVMAKAIGDNNVFEAKCYVGPEVEVGNGCIIGGGISLRNKEKLQDNTIITGSNYNRTIASDHPPPQALQLEFLTKVLPNYHHLKKPNEQQRPNVL